MFMCACVPKCAYAHMYIFSDEHLRNVVDHQVVEMIILAYMDQASDLHTQHNRQQHQSRHISRILVTRQKYEYRTFRFQIQIHPAPRGALEQRPSCLLATSSLVYKLPARARL
jgi:hypothetical protein